MSCVEMFTINARKCKFASPEINLTHCMQFKKMTYKYSYCYYCSSSISLKRFLSMLVFLVLLFSNGYSGLGKKTCLLIFMA